MKRLEDPSQIHGSLANCRCGVWRGSQPLLLRPSISSRLHKQIVLKHHWEQHEPRLSGSCTCSVYQSPCRSSTEVDGDLYANGSLRRRTLTLSSFLLLKPRPQTPFAPFAWPPAVRVPCAGAYFLGPCTLLAILLHRHPRQHAVLERSEHRS